MEEQGDLLVLYKNMLLGGLKKDNFKELSKRMGEIGWERNNDQCRQQVISMSQTEHYFLKFLLSYPISHTVSKFQQVKLNTLLQIYLLQDRFDKMNSGESKSGTVETFEPLRVELNDCFNSLKNVQPDSVYSSRKGLIVHKSNDDTTGDEDSNDVEIASEKSDEQKTKRERKSIYLQQLTNIL